jgi:hypothetical protein
VRPSGLIPPEKIVAKVLEEAFYVRKYRDGQKNP